VIRFLIISAGGTNHPEATSDVAIEKLTVGGRVEFAQILGGYNPYLEAINSDAQIGLVKVGGDWIASSLAAGVMNLGADDVIGGTGLDADNVNFGDTHDTKIVEVTDSAAILSLVQRIEIAGQIFGTPGAIRPDDRFGFVAEEIGTLKVGAQTFNLNAGPNNDGVLIGLQTATFLS
jgi:hypothetical protein